MFRTTIESFESSVENVRVEKNVQNEENSDRSFNDVTNHFRRDIKIEANKFFLLINGPCCVLFGLERFAFVNLKKKMVKTVKNLIRFAISRVLARPFNVRESDT